MIEIENLSICFGNFYAVNGISFSVPAGEIFGLLGANGAGKTTTIRVLCGLLKPTSGRTTINDIDVASYPQKVKSQIGYMSQLFTLYGDLTVEENLAFTAGLRRMDKDFFEKRKKHLLNLIGLNIPENVLVRDLPGGIRQHISLAAAVLHDPPVIFLDEPTAGVTPAARENFWRLIQNLVDEGKTVIVTTHYLDEAEKCNRVALMTKGTLAANDTPANLKKTCFPHGVYELTAKKNTCEEIIEWVQQQGAVCSIQPYGLRYHAFIYDFVKWKAIQQKLKEHFIITEKEPSLEDVFIEVIERGKNEDH